MTVFFSEIAAQGELYRAPVLRTGHWDYPGLKDGLNITHQLMDELVAHFNDGSRGFEVPVNRDHDPKSDCGWVKKLYREGDNLVALFDITDPKTKEDVDRKTLRYTSSEFSLSWFDPEAKTKKAVFEGFALTNRPFIKKMRPVEKIVCLSELGGVEDEEEPRTQEEEPIVTPEELAAKDAEITRLKLELAEAKASSSQPDATLKLAELEAQQILLADQVRKSNAALKLAGLKERLAALVRSKRLAAKPYARLVNLAETLYREGKEIVTLSESKIRLSEDPNEVPTDQVDVVEQIVDMLEQVPAAEVIDVDKLEAAATGEDAPEELSEDELEKITQLSEKLMQDQSIKLSVEEAHLKAFEQVMAERKGGKQ